MDTLSLLYKVSQRFFTKYMQSNIHRINSIRVTVIRFYLNFSYWNDKKRDVSRKTLVSSGTRRWEYKQKSIVVLKGFFSSN